MEFLPQSNLAVNDRPELFPRQIRDCSKEGLISRPIWTEAAILRLAGVGHRVAFRQHCLPVCTIPATIRNIALRLVQELASAAAR